MRLIVRCAALAGVAVATALVLAPAAFAHARVSPAVSLAGKLQLYGLAVPTEKENLTTTRVVLTVPQGSGSTRSCPRQAGRGSSSRPARVTARSCRR